MKQRMLRRSWRALVLLGLTGARSAGPPEATQPSSGTVAVTVLAGGCYWGVESVFRHVRGVESAVSGFAVPAPSVGSVPGLPAEAVRVRYDPTLLSYREILALFFTVAHDPTHETGRGRMWVPSIGRSCSSRASASGARCGPTSTH
jgi:peptide-methionine (S)-S-oxide reductase